jgi:hypothetical protein
MWEEMGAAPSNRWEMQQMAACIHNGNAHGPLIFLRFLLAQLRQWLEHRTIRG